MSPERKRPRKDVRLIYNGREMLEVIEDDQERSLRPRVRVNLPWRELLHQCQRNERLLTEYERQFVLGMAKWTGAPTDKQLRFLGDVHERLTALPGFRW